MKKLGLLVLALGIIFSSCNKGGDKNVTLSTDEDKTFYAMGVMLGSNIERLGLSERELDTLMKGLRDSAKGGKPEIELAQYQPKIQALVMDRMQKVSEKEKTKGKEYFDKFSKEEGVKKTESGVAYKILKEGTGVKPTATDTVEVHYHGTLIDGTVFDSSVERGKTVSFPLNRVIKGWTDGLQVIGEGGKVKLVIPAELAYGERGAGKIPGGATLTFEVELFKVSKTVEPAAPAVAPKMEKKLGKKPEDKKKK